MHKNDKRGDSMLTPKQEQFAKNIVIENMTQADAYRQAYDAENMSDNAIYREASLLVDNPKVAQRMKELRAELDNPKIMSAQKRLEWLTEVIQSKDETMKNRLTAVEIINKMQGEYVQKVQAEVDSNVTINIELTDE